MRQLSSDEVKAKELEILVAFDQYAKDQGIPYSLGYGTLLGAARHKGFIPWDDDIDVVVLRPYYDRIVSAARNGESISGYKIVGYEVNSFPMPFLKLVNPEITVKDHATKDTIPLNLWIDIFPLDGCPSDVEAFDKQFRKSYLYRAFIKTGNYKFIGAGKTRAKRILRMAAVPFVSLLKLNDWAEKKLALLLRNNTPYEKADTYANLAWGNYERGEMIRTDMISGFEELEFEGRKFSVIAGWREWLTGLYGDDCMELPPEDKRVSHGVQAWTKEEGDNG